VLIYEPWMLGRRAQETNGVSIVATKALQCLLRSLMDSLILL